MTRYRFRPTTRERGNLYRTLRNSAVTRIDPRGLTEYTGSEANACCVAINEDLCVAGCLKARDRGYRGAAGAVICFRGKKCKCYWPDRYPFYVPWGGPLFQCLVAHEQSHFDRTGPCPPMNPKACDLITGPPGGGRNKREQECPAYRAQLECLLQISHGQRDVNWEGMKKHVDDAMATFTCD